VKKSNPEDWKKLEESSKLNKKINQMYIPNNIKETEEAFTDKTQELVTKLICHLICYDLLPTTIIDSTYFKRILEILQPKYILACRDHIFKVIIPKIYEEYKNNLKSYMGKYKNMLDKPRMNTK